jgi:Putative Flp pilus-assembly TadE/G-like/Putative Tad-like Flp pilus-assembly
MKTWNTLFEQRGGVAILIAVCLVVLLSFTALVIDIGHGLVVKNQLHNAADAASLAGTSCLAIIYAGGSRPACGTYPQMPYAQQQSYVLTAAHRAAIIAEVQDAAQKNAAGGTSISIDPADIRIGQWDVQDRTLTVTDVRPTAVEVTARRDGSANGPITTFLANIIGVSSLSIRATAIRNGQQEEPTAALTGVGYVAPGELDIPVGISAEWFRNKEVFCDQNIRFFPTNDPIGCAGWNTFNLSPANSNTLRKDILQELPPFGSYQSPEATAGVTQFEFTGGNVASALPDLQALFNANKKPDPSSPTGYVWETFVVVYESADCSNPSGSITIVGFASVAITNVLSPPAGQLIEGKVKCDLVQPNTRGGGAEFGTLGSIPGLVQ